MHQGTCFDVRGETGSEKGHKFVVGRWDWQKKHVRSREVSTSEAVKNQFFFGVFNLYPSASTSHIGRWSESPYQTIMNREVYVLSSQTDWCCIPSMVWSSLSWAYLEQKTAMIICNQTGMIKLYMNQTMVKWLFRCGWFTIAGLVPILLEYERTLTLTTN